MNNKLVYEEKTVREVNYNNFDDFIRQYYPHYDSIVSVEELSNYISKTYKVEKEELDEQDLQSLEEFQNGVFKNYITCKILKDLCNKGLIEPAEYLVKIFW